MKQITFRISDEDYEFLDGLSNDSPKDYIKKGVVNGIENKRNPIPNSKELLRRLLETWPMIMRGKSGFKYFSFGELYIGYFEKYGSSKKEFKKELEKLLDTDLIRNSKGEWIISLSKGMYKTGDDIITKYSTWKYIQFWPDKYEGELTWRNRK